MEVRCTLGVLVAFEGTQGHHQCTSSGCAVLGYASLDADADHYPEHRKAGRLQLRQGHWDRFASPDGNARNSIRIVQINVLNVRVEIGFYDVISINSAIFAPIGNRRVPMDSSSCVRIQCQCIPRMESPGAVMQIDGVRRENGVLSRWKNMI